MTATVTGRSHSIPPWRRRAARAILVIAALGAVASFVGAAASIRSTGSEALVAESWRMFGFLVFAGLFLLLAYRPNRYPGVWELAIFHKAAVAAFLLVAGGEAVDAASTAAVDGVLAVALLAAYLLVEGHRNWDGFRRSAPDHRP